FLFRCCLPSAYRFLDIRHHAAAMSLRAVAYASGERDRGVRPEDTRELAALAGGRFHIVPGAGHLAAIKSAAGELHPPALDTFRRAEESHPAAVPSGACAYGLETRACRVEASP